MDPFAPTVEEQNLRLLGQLIKRARDEHPLPWTAQQKGHLWQVTAADGYLVAEKLHGQEANRLTSLAQAGGLTPRDQQAVAAFVAWGISA